jgi:hypothetical protein
LTRSSEIARDRNHHSQVPFDLPRRAALSPTGGFGERAA